MLRKAIFCLLLFSGSVFCSGSNPAMAQVNRGGGAPFEALPDDLKELEIEDFFVPCLAKQVGVIHALQGQVVVIHRGTKQAYFGREGDPIYENDSLTTLGNSRCRIKFENEDVVTMAPETNFGVDGFEDRRGEGRKRSFFSMLKGKAMFYALRLFKYRETRFSVKTPTAIVGVRGTKFGAHVYWVDGEKSAGAGIQVADRGNELGVYLAQLGPAGTRKSYTDCFAEDGYLDVNGKRVGPGEMYRGESGMIIPTPPEVLKAFQRETEVKAEKAEEKGGEAEDQTEEAEGGEEKAEKEEEEKSEEAAEEEAILIGTQEGAVLAENADITENVSDATQQEIGMQTESEAGESIDNGFWKGKISGEGGYISTMILNDTNGNPYNDMDRDPMYFSHTRNTFSGGAEKHIAYENAHPNDDKYKMVVQEISYPAMDMEVTSFKLDHPHGTDGDVVVTAHNFQWNHGGGYKDKSGHEYLEWGWWNDTEAPIGKIGEDDLSNNPFFAASGMVWEVEGDLTHPDAISFLQQQNFQAAYKGGTKGVFGDSTGVEPTKILSGDFSCNIDFGTAQVRDFVVDARDDVDQHRVYLVGGQGNLNPDGSFHIPGDSFSTNSRINNNPLEAGGGDNGANGSCYGAKAEGVGGVWYAHDGNTFFADGEFHGER